jgi:hypothetical protein
MLGNRDSVVGNNLNEYLGVLVTYTIGSLGDVGGSE